MDLEKIAELVKIIENSSLKEFSYSEGEMEIYLSKLDNPPVIAPGGAAPVTAAAPAPAQPAAVEAPAEEGHSHPGRFCLCPWRWREGAGLCGKNPRRAGQSGHPDLSAVGNCIRRNPPGELLSTPSAMPKSQASQKKPDSHSMLLRYHFRHHPGFQFEAALSGTETTGGSRNIWRTVSPAPS